MSRPLLSRMRRALPRLCVLYLLMALILSGCADRLILHPSRQHINKVDARRELIAGPSGSLEVWKFQPPGPDLAPTAIVLHFIGNASRAEWEGEYVADQWRGRPVEVWAVNYPGFGGSEGPARLSSIAPAALAAFDAATARQPSLPVIVSGRSIGTTAALHVAAHRPAAGVILHSPPPLRRLIIGRFGWWNLWLAAIPVSLHVPGDLDSLANAGHCSAPAIFILSGSDALVPPAYQQRVMDAYAGPKQRVWMPTADHNDPVEGEARSAFEDASTRLLSTLPTRPAAP